MWRLIRMSVILAVFSACTHHQAYDSMQTSQKNECEKLPLTQRDDCLKRLTTSYKDYEHERQKLEKK